MGANFSWFLPILLVAFFAQTSFERGLEAFRKRDFTAAEQAFQEAAQQEPSNARAYKLLGMTYAAQQKFRLAEDPFRKACTLNPKEENACYYLGRTYYSLDRFDDAIKAFDTALRKSPRGKELPLLGLAQAHEATGRIAEAERYYKEVLRSGDREVFKAFGLFLFKQGRGKESLEYLTKAGATEDLERVKRALASQPQGKTSAPPERAAAPSLRFEMAPLDMIVKNGAFGDKHQIETMIAGAAVFDYDADGWPDIFIANGASIPSLRKSDPGFRNRMFRNNHDGSFTDVTEKAGVAGKGYSMGVATADFDNDGHVDLFVTGVRFNILYHNRGDGTFEDVTARAGLAGDDRWAVAAGWFDYDNDGKLDLFVVHYVTWDPATEIHCGLLKPGYRTYCHPKHYQALPNSLYHNEGGGRFRDVSAESGIGAHAGKGMGVAFADYDEDGRLDVFVANDTVPNFLFHNDGGGKFTEVAMEAGVAYNSDGNASSFMGADFRDYDNDGREDIFVTALTNEMYSIYRNLGKGRFADVAAPARIASATLPWGGWSTGFYDFNNDGLKDVFTANSHVMDNAELTSSRKSRQPNTVFLNNGDGTFRCETLTGEAFHRGAAFGDFDRDGRVDVVVTRLNEQPFLLKNVSASTGHWISLRLVGTRSNRDGIGAWIHLVTDLGEQWNRVTTSVGYGCSSDRTAHFGLGRVAKVKAIEITWPSGVKQRLEDVQGDRHLSIEEEP